MSHHLEVIHNYEHLSPAPVVVSDAGSQAVLDASQTMLDFMARKVKPEHGTYFRQIFFNHGRADDVYKEFRDWATEIAQLAFGDKLLLDSAHSPATIAIHAVTDAEIFNDFLANNQHDPFANWHTDPYENIDHRQGIDAIKLASSPRRLMVLRGPGTIAVKGTVRAEKAHYFIPPHSAEITYENDYGQHPGTLVGIDGQFLRGACSTDDGRVPLCGDLEYIQIPTDTWVDIPPQCVHAVPENVPDGRIVVMVNPPHSDQ